jgi:hypothetical protein
LPVPLIKSRRGASLGGFCIGGFSYPILFTACAQEIGKLCPAFHSTLDRRLSRIKG